MHPNACAKIILGRPKFITRLSLILLGFFLSPGLLTGQEIETVRLSPLIYLEGLAQTTLSEIPARVIEPFLARPLVIEAGGLDDAPRVVATQESRINVGLGSQIYVSGLLDKSGAADQAQNWQLFRPGKTLVDPDTGQTLGVEALYLGTARLERPGAPATLRITSSRLEVGVGDRLVAIQQPDHTQHILRKPGHAVNGRIIGMMAGLANAEGGQYSIISINRGLRDGIEQGHMLALYRAKELTNATRITSTDRTSPLLTLPEERYGLIYVFRSFDKVAYALVVESSRQIKPGDLIKSP